MSAVVWDRWVRQAARAAVGIALVASIALATSGSAEARDGHWSGGGHWGGGHWGGGHWGGGGWGGGGWGGHHWHGGWGPSWGFSIGLPLYPRYYDPYYDPYYYPRTVVIERPSYAWPVYNQLAYDRAMSAPLGESVSWDDGNSAGTVTATREGRADGRYCREFQQSIIIDGKRQQAFGAACQTPDGGWEIVPDNE